MQDTEEKAKHAMQERSAAPARGYGRRPILVNATAWIGAIGVDARAQTPAPRLLLLGDSLTAGYGLPQIQAFPVRLQAALTKAGVKAEIVNAGVSGDTSAGGLARLEWAIGDKPPSHAIVALGANDGLRGLPPEQMEANLDQIVTRLRSRGTRILLAGIYAPPNLGRDYAERFNAVYPTLARKHQVALYPFFLDGVAAIAALNQNDGIHPNAAGVDVIVERMLPAVHALLAR